MLQERKDLDSISELMSNEMKSHLVNKLKLTHVRYNKVASVN